MADIICKKCGLINSVHVVEKNGQKTVWCDGCGAYIKNLGYAEDKFYFGKYKGIKVSDCVDKQYMEWFLNAPTIKKSEKMREALRKQIETLLV